MDPRQRQQFAIRCIVVSTQAAVASIGRSYAAEPQRRDSLQREAQERGRVLLAALQSDSEPMSDEFAVLMRAARASLGA